MGVERGGQRGGMLVGWGFGGAGAPGRAGVGSLQEAPTWKACVGLEKVRLGGGRGWGVSAHLQGTCFL